MDKMKLFQNIPIEIENIIWIYTGLYKLRNGKLMRQIKHYPPIIVNLIQQHSGSISGYNFFKYKSNANRIMISLNKYIMNNDIHLFITKDIHPNKIIYSSGISEKNINNKLVKFYFPEYILK
jgi:hypothetical protein